MLLQCIMLMSGASDVTESTDRVDGATFEQLLWQPSIEDSLTEEHLEEGKMEESKKEEEVTSGG